MCGIRRRQDGGTRGVPCGGKAMMHIGRRVEPEAAVMIFSVVPAKEIDAVRPGVFQRAKARGKIRAILERLALRLRLRIAIRHVLARM